jgi:hypothetical protein
MGTAFDLGVARSTDGFAIIENTGYTIRHEQSDIHAQLYAIDRGDPSSAPAATHHRFANLKDTLNRKS